MQNSLPFAKGRGISSLKPENCGGRINTGACYMRNESSFSLAAEEQRLIAVRHELHAHPELALQEEWTSSFLAQELRKMGLPVYTNIGGYGVVAVVEGAAPGPMVMLRADMDGLAINELTGLPYASKEAGKMHACGHDGHMAMVLGAARYLAATKNFHGSVALVFQPAEERYGGARRMVTDGLLERFPARAIFGLHNWPGLPVGEVVVHDGPVMAATSEFSVSFTTSGGHAAQPHLTGDPILAGGLFIAGLQQAVARAVDPYEPAVATVGSFHAGNAQNIIPNCADLAGTLRAFGMETLKLLQTRVEIMAHSAAAMAGCAEQHHFDEPFCPPVINTPHERDIMRKAVGLSGLKASSGEAKPAMTGDDFGDFLKFLPGAYAWIGNGQTHEDAYLHQPCYDFNDAMLVKGAMFLAKTAELALNEQA